MGARVRYRAQGRGPAVVLVHGLGSSLEVWNWTVPALRDRYTVITFDFPGFGFSEPRPSAFTPEGAGRTVLALMDALGVRRAALIGSSLGGGIATIAAGLAPERCAALVLTAPGGFDRGLSVWMRLLSVPGIGEALMAGLRLKPNHAVLGSFQNPDRIPSEMFEIARRDLARPTYGPTVLRGLRAVASFRGVDPEVVVAVRDAAARITAPTLVVWGTADRVIPPAQADAAGRIIRHARVHRFAGLGHAPYIEAAEAFNTLMLGFLAEVYSPVEIGARR
jgi:pimeloyl-ACP methyl ester carboxylesterase